MVRFVAPLLLLLEVLAALVPAQGLFVCLGAPGRAGGASDVAASCDCGHHDATTDGLVGLTRHREPTEAAPISDDCDGCVDLDIDPVDALRPEPPGDLDWASTDDRVDIDCTPGLCRAPRPDLARAPGPPLSQWRRAVPPISVRVLRERATVQLLL